MLRAALEISGGIHAYLEKWLNDFRDDYLEFDDWESLKEIASFLTARRLQLKALEERLIK